MPGGGLRESKSLYNCGDYLSVQYAWDYMFESLCGFAFSLFKDGKQYRGKMGGRVKLLDPIYCILIFVIQL